jgi:hypothetical protein
LCTSDAHPQPVTSDAIPRRVSVYVERAPHVHQPHYPPALPTHQPRTGFSLPPRPLAASTSLATSPPRTSPHARPLVSTATCTPHCTNTKRATAIPPRRSHPSEPEPRTVCVLRVTPAPAPSCGVVAGEGVSSGEGVVVQGEGSSSPCGGAVLGPLSCCECV